MASLSRILLTEADKRQVATEAQAKIVPEESLSEPKKDLPLETRRGKYNQASRVPKRAPADT
jgi:hypothetical protein